MHEKKEKKSKLLSMVTYHEVDIEIKQSVNQPNQPIGEVSEREIEWHVLHTLRLDYHSLSDVCRINKKYQERTRKLEVNLNKQK